MSRDQVRAFDAWAINEVGVPGAVLMENAGRNCAEIIMDKLPELPKPKVCVFCGTGNNGGDGYVIARHLLNSGLEVRVVVLGDREKIKGDAKTNLDILEEMGAKVRQLDLGEPDVADKIKTHTADADLIVDAIFGTGLKGQLRADYAEWINTINALDVPIMAVDIPSGLNCDSGEPLGAAIKADFTVTFVAMKRGFTAPAAHEYTGDVYVASIGVEPKSMQSD